MTRECHEVSIVTILVMTDYCYHVSSSLIPSKCNVTNFYLNLSQPLGFMISSIVAGDQPRINPRQCPDVSLSLGLAIPRVTWPLRGEGGLPPSAGPGSERAGPAAQLRSDTGTVKMLSL